MTRRSRGGWARARPLNDEELARRGLNAAAQLARDDPLWPGQLAILVALVLYLVLPPKLTLGPNWLVPVAEGVLFAGLVIAAPMRGYSPSRRRALALVLLSLVTIANLVALGLLTHYLIIGGRGPGGG